MCFRIYSVPPGHDIFTAASIFTDGETSEKVVIFVGLRVQDCQAWTSPRLLPLYDKCAAVDGTRGGIPAILLG